MPVIFGGAYSLHHGQSLATAVFDSTAFAGFAVEILNIDSEKIGDREELEITSMWTQPLASGIGNRAFIPSTFQDPGTFKLLIHFDASMLLPITAWASGSNVSAAVGASNSNIGTVTFYMGPALTVQNSFSVAVVWVKNFNIHGPLDGKTIQAEMTLRLTAPLDTSYPTYGAVQQTVSS